MQFGQGNCQTSCGACVNNATCGTSQANCSWTPDLFSSDLDGDGAFIAAKDGMCEPAMHSARRDCAQNCFACLGQSLCEQTAGKGNMSVIGGCTWAAQYNTCLPGNGSAKEICFIPGDEDANNFSDCADTACANDPVCGMGANGVGIGGPGAGMGSFDPALCTQWWHNQAGCLGQNGTSGSALENQSVCFFHPAPGQTSMNATNGACDPQFQEQMREGMRFDSAPTILGTDVSGDAGGQGMLDLLEMGISTVPGKADRFSMGLRLANLTDAAWCGAVYPGGLNRSVAYYRFIDVDENTTNGCALPSNGSSMGWEYQFVFEDNSSHHDRKTAYRCVGGAWMPFSAQVTTIKDMCVMPGGQMSGGVHIMVLRMQDIGNPRRVVRFFASTGNQSRNASNPVDGEGPYHYTPGSVDVSFENCNLPGSDNDGDGLDSENDPDCQKFLTFGYIPMEVGPQCRDGLDNDGNGLTDCDDQSCKYDAFGICNAGGLACDGTDKRAPLLKWLDVKAVPTFAFIKFTSDKPSNGTLTLYTDSGCGTSNTTLYDSALRNSITEDDYRPSHDVFLDTQTLGYALTPNTTYHYKIAMSDVCGNRLVSACLNFTTTNNFDTFVFRPVPSSGVLIDMPGLGITGENFTYGRSLNASDTSRTTLTVRDPANGFSISLENASIFEAGSFNISTIYNASGNETYVGMSGDSWSLLETSISPEHIQITIPDNGTELWKCDEDNLSNCINVTSVVTCTFGANTTCTIPLVSGLGFSVYAVRSVTASVASPALAGSGGGGGGGGGGIAGAVAYRQAEVDVETGIERTITRFGTYYFRLKGEKAEHTIRIVRIDEASVTFRIQSTPLEVTLARGETTDIDVTGDGAPDFELTLVGFTSNLVTFRINGVQSVINAPTGLTTGDATGSDVPAGQAETAPGTQALTGNIATDDIIAEETVVEGGRVMWFSVAIVILACLLGATVFWLRNQRPPTDGEGMREAPAQTTVPATASAAPPIAPSSVEPPHHKPTHPPKTEHLK
jgi:hypothetical protein